MKYEVETIHDILNHLALILYSSIKHRLKRSVGYPKRIIDPYVITELYGSFCLSFLPSLFTHFALPNFV